MSDHSQKSISRQIIVLAIPIIFSNLSRVVMGLTDMAMVSRLGSNALAATGMGSLLLWVIMSMGIGLRTAVQTVSSRRLGQRKYPMCGNALYNGLLLAIIISIPLTIVCVYSVADICSYFLKDLEVITLCSGYMVIGCFSFIFVLTAFTFQGFYAGIEKTRVHMVVTITSNVLNIYLNAGLIYGSDKIQQFFTDLGIPWLALVWNWLPFPSWGVKGAAAATLIASIWMVVHYSFFLLKAELKKYWPYWNEFHITNIIQQIKLGFPIGIQEMISMAGFSIFYKIIGIIGTVELATSHVILNIAHASFMPAIGIGMAASTLIGKFLGEKSPDKAGQTVIVAVKWSLLIMGTGGIIFIFLPGWIIPIFSDDDQIINMGIPCLQIIGVLQFFDAVGLTLYFVLIGAGNTLFPALVNMIICWTIFIPLAYFLGIVLEMGVTGAWLGFGGWIIPFAVIMALKVRTGSWKKIEV